MLSKLFKQRWKIKHTVERQAKEIDIKQFTVETDSKNLNYTLKVKGHSKEQLKSISG